MITNLLMITKFYSTKSDLYNNGGVNENNGFGKTLCILSRIILEVKIVFKEFCYSSGPFKSFFFFFSSFQVVCEKDGKKSYWYLSFVRRLGFTIEI